MFFDSASAYFGQPCANLRMDVRWTRRKKKQKTCSVFLGLSFAAIQCGFACSDCEAYR
jgi:hypothetical protein